MIQWLLFSVNCNPCLFLPWNHLFISLPEYLFQRQCPPLIFSGGRLASVGSSQTRGFGRSSAHSAACQVLHAGSPPGCSILGAEQHQNLPKSQSFRRERTRPQISPTILPQQIQTKTGGVKWLHDDSDSEHVTSLNRKYVISERIYHILVLKHTWLLVLVHKQKKKVC